MFFQEKLEVSIRTSTLPRVSLIKSRQTTAGQQVANWI